MGTYKDPPLLCPIQKSWIEKFYKKTIDLKFWIEMTK